LGQCGQGGRGSIFRDFVRTSFMDGPLAKPEENELKCFNNAFDQAFI